MRRAVSVILFILAGWVLSAGLMMAWIDLGEATGGAARIFVLGIFALFAAPFFLGAIWASPGNRLAEFGLALMIVAAIGAGLALVMFMAMNDPGFKQLMPPDQPLPDLRFAAVSGAATTLLIGGGGYLARRWALARHRQQRSQLGDVFD